MSSKPIVVVGSINLDMICELSRLPLPGETLTAKSFSTAFGGKGANQAVAASRLGSKVCMIGMVGSDSTGFDMIANFRRNDIDISGVKTADDESSGTACINIEENGENTIVVYPGANACVDCDLVHEFSQTIENAACLMLQLEIPMPAVIEAAKIAKNAGVPVILNPAPAATLPDELLSYCSYITPNQSELAQISNTSDIEKGAKILFDKGVNAVVVTLGGQGCLYIDKYGSFKVPSIKVKSVDATAAGDSFSGAFANIVKNLNGRRISEEDLLFCNASGALATTKLGAQPSIPTKAEVEEILKK